VTTLPEYRHRGLQRILQTEYHKQLSEEGYDLSAIEGIPYFYRQFGYEYALPLLEQVTMRFDEVPDYKVTNEIRPFTESDIPQASGLLKRAQEKFYVHTVRDAGIWKMQQETGMIAEYRFDGYVVEEDEKIRAYFRVSYNPDEKELLLREITDVGHGTAKSILGFLKNVGTERGLETLVATISHQGSFAEHMAAIGGIKKVPPYAWQLRIMDYAGMFRKLTPLFEKRLEESIHRDLTETVNFNFYRFTIQVDVENGTIKSVQCVETSEDRSMRASPSVFTQLLFGYRSREELETIYPDFMVRPTHKDLVDVMFPKLPSYIHTEY
jgi:predicted acetyltransferase